MTKALSWAIVLFFIAPILKILTMVQWPQHWIVEEFFRVFYVSALQAGASSILVFSFGFFVALGLVSMTSRRARRMAEFIFLLPSALPALFSILASLQLVNLIASFPFGFWGVVLVHVVMYTGFMGVFLAGFLERRAGGLIELATVEGARTLDILWQVLRAWKSELLTMVFVVFALTFSSFSVPLVVGAGKNETLEVLIYRLLFGQGATSQALILAVVQMAILTGFAYFTVNEDVRSAEDLRQIKKIGQPVTLILSLGFVLALLIVNIGGFFRGALQIMQNSEQLNQFFQLSWGTAGQAITTGVGVVLFGTLLAFLFLDRLTDRFFLLYSVPSVALVGLAFYLFFDLTLMNRFLRTLLLGWAFLLVVFSSLYRLKLRPAFLSMRTQVEVARVLGAGRFMRFYLVVWPQTRVAIFSAGGLAAFWAAGDFALATMISGEPITLALAAQSFLGGYRLEIATFYTVAALVVGGIFFLILEVLGRVVGQKSISNL